MDFFVAISTSLLAHSIQVSITTPIQKRKIRNNKEGGIEKMKEFLLIMLRVPRAVFMELLLAVCPVPKLQLLLTYWVMESLSDLTCHTIWQVKSDNSQISNW